MNNKNMYSRAEENEVKLFIEYLKQDFNNNSQMSGEIISISSDEEAVILKKPKLEKVPTPSLKNFTKFKAPGDGHCITHCFAKRFEESSSHVLQRLWNEINNRIDVYMQFGEYDTPDTLRNELSKYTFDKSYGHDTADLVIEALSNIFKCNVLIHDKEIQENPQSTVGECFLNTMHLLKSNDHYDLLVERRSDDVLVKNESLSSITDERLVTNILYRICCIKELFKNDAT